MELAEKLGKKTSVPSLLARLGRDVMKTGGSVLIFSEESASRDGEERKAPKSGNQKISKKIVLAFFPTFYP